MGNAVRGTTSTTLPVQLTLQVVDVFDEFFLPIRSTDFPGVLDRSEEHDCFVTTTNYCTVDRGCRAPKLPSSRFGFGNFQKLPETSKRKFPYLKKVSIVDNATGIYTTPIYSRQIKNSVYTAVLYCI